MTILNSIKTELQHMIEAIHAITNIDITVVDENLQRIAATSFLKEGIGEKAPSNSVFQQCLATGNQYFIENPTNNPACFGCARRENCMELAQLCIPIRFNERIIGVLGMCAFNHTARRNLIGNRDSYIAFESQLGSIISTMLGEKEFGTQLEYRSYELMTLINSLSEGIMILDINKNIITTNRYINEKLHLAVGSMPGLREVLSPGICDRLEHEGFNGEVGPFTLSDFEFIITASPIHFKNEKKGFILVFSDFTKMRESVLKSARSRNLITFDEILGESEPLSYARQQAIQVAEKDVSVLLTGETGTGKEIFARAIHAASRRKDEIFMAINCGAIPENLLESELFGYEKGSFTGANAAGKPGKFEICKDGTLFLDEIGDLPLSMQVKLLRALEEKEIVRVGGHTPIKVNPRIISASHKDLHSMVAAGTFREDLFYRLNVVPIHIPPLRERGYDVIILSRYFLEHFSRVYNKNLKGFTPECEDLLMRYSYPGNIRELRNLIEYAVIFEKNDLVGTDNLQKKLRSNEERKHRTLAEMTREYEKMVIKNELRRFGQSLDAKRRIADRLGISIATLYRKMDE